jgi:hypothetical protein
MDFTAEIIRTSQRKLASNDNQYEIVLRTDNPLILDLGKLPSDTLFGVSITLHHNSEENASKANAEYEQI